MAVVVLDRQHVGVPSRRFADAGAWADLDSDGQRDVHEQEALLTPRYILAAEERLRALGHDVVVISDGQYAERHARAKAYRGTVYVACHLNAGGGDYGLVCYDHRSTRGRELAGLIASALGQQCPELRRTIARAASETEWTNAYRCIAGVYDGTPTGICYEPAFLDTPAHRPLLTESGLVRMGLALADGIHALLKGATG